MRTSACGHTNLSFTDRKTGPCRIAPSLSLAPIARSGPACFRALGRNTRFDAAVRQRDRDRNNLDFGHAVVPRNADLLRRRTGEIHDPALHIRPSVLDRDNSTLASLEVGHLRRRTERKRLARRIVAMRVHWG